ncbi:hypothetical protein THASP1DRAFT_23569, partial [Thamnocephalis sphaerospora]
MSQPPTGPNAGGGTPARPAANQRTTSGSSAAGSGAGSPSPTLGASFSVEQLQQMMAGQRQQLMAAAAANAGAAGRMGARSLTPQMPAAFAALAAQNVAGGSSTGSTAASATAAGASTPVMNAATLRQHVNALHERIQRAHQVLQYPNLNEMARQQAQSVLQESTTQLNTLVRKVQEAQQAAQAQHIQATAAGP